MNLFYHPLAKHGEKVILDAPESVHLVKVLRKKDGDLIDFTDGKGNHFKATLEIQKRQTIAIMDSAIFYPPSPSFLEIAIAPTKNVERLEWFVEKAVEFGIEKISLIHCQNSERPHLKLDRLERIAISAMKQSLKFYLPQITEMTSYTAWLDQCNTEVKCIAHCREDQVRKSLKNTLVPGKTTCIAIGPEGDFSKEEIAAANQKGFLGVSLGSSRLRTETAAIAAVHTFELINQVD
jgi:16S rRNA (uracil1498-N3)-methyltransferase